MRGSDPPPWLRNNDVQRNSYRTRGYPIFLIFGSLPQRSKRWYRKQSITLYGSERFPKLLSSVLLAKTMAAEKDAAHYNMSGAEYVGKWIQVDGMGVGYVAQFHKVKSKFTASKHSVDFSFCPDTPSKYRSELQQMVLRRRKSGTWGGSNKGTDFDMCNDKTTAMYEECRSMGFKTLTDFQSCKISGFTDKASYEECKRKGFSTKAALEEAVAMGAASKDEVDAIRKGGYADKASYDECVRKGFLSKAALDEAAAMGASTKAELEAFLSLGFDSKDKYDQFLSMGFTASAEEKAAFDTCISLGFDNKADFDACTSMGFSGKEEYEECVQLGLRSKEEYDAAKNPPVAEAENPPVAEGENPPVAEGENPPVAEAENPPVAEAENPSVAEAEVPDLKDAEPSGADASEQDDALDELANFEAEQLPDPAPAADESPASADASPASPPEPPVEAPPAETASESDAKPAVPPKRKSAVTLRKEALEAQHQKKYEEAQAAKRAGGLNSDKKQYRGAGWDIQVNGPAFNAYSFLPTPPPVRPRGEEKQELDEEQEEVVEEEEEEEHELRYEPPEGVDVLLCIRDRFGNYRGYITEEGECVNNRDKTIGWINRDEGTAGTNDEHYLGTCIDQLSGNECVVEDALDERCGSINLGTATIHDNQMSTVAEFEANGSVVGNHGSGLGKFEGFSYPEIRTVALYLMLIDPGMLNEVEG